MFSFGMTDNVGMFTISNIPNGDYRLLITHVSYHNSNKYFSITNNTKEIDFGNVVMSDALDGLT